MGRFVLVAALLALSLLGLPARGETLRMVANPWSPFTDQNLLNDGLATDLVRTALRRAGYASTYQELPWPRVLRGLQLGDYDLAVAAWYSAERNRFALYSDPYLLNSIRFMRRVGSNVGYKTLAGLDGLSIAVARGYSYGSGFDQHPRLKRVMVADFQMAARMLAAGRVDLALDDEIAARYQLNTGLAELRPRLEFVGPPLGETGLYLLVRRSHPLHQQIVRDFNQAIEAMKGDGTYKKIFKRHSL